MTHLPIPDMVVSNAVCTMPLTLQDSTTPCEQRDFLSRERGREGRWESEEEEEKK